MQPGSTGRRSSKHASDDLRRKSRLFGTAIRTAILIAVRMLEQTYPSELAQVLGTHVYNVQTAVKALESDGVVTSRRFGTTRQVMLNPRWFAHAPLAALLWEMGSHDVELQEALASRRRRPRRAGKPGL